MTACFGEGLNGMGDIYQFSNQRTLGQSEEDIIHNLDSVVQQMSGRNSVLVSATAMSPKTPSARRVIAIITGCATE